MGHGVRARIEHKATIDAAESGPFYLNGRHPATVTVIPDGNGSEGKVQFTTTPAGDVAAGNGEWQDWPEGAVDAPTTDALIGPVTALRLVKTTGDALSWEISA